MIQARSLWLAVMVLGLAACASKPQAPAPIVERSATPAVRPATPAPPPVVRDNGRDSYVVQRGDTLYSIALAKGIDPRELARWNEISNPSLIQVGQVLRLKPSVADATITAEASAVASTAPVTAGHAVETRPLSSAPVVAAIKPDATKPEPSKPEAPKADAVSSPIAFLWPAKGAVIGTFEEPRNKGIDIAGVEGEPVVAAADGEVAYIGSALRGYGNLVIIKHSDDFVSAYAHNKQVVVKQGQAVKKGQRIADLGKSDADRPKLHFEIRRQGKPVDPIRYLPAR